MFTITFGQVMARKKFQTIDNFFLVFFSVSSLKHV